MRQMANKDLDRAAIIQHLAKKLPDKVIKELFPGIAPDGIRNVLLGKKKIAGPAVRQHSLFKKDSASKQATCKLFTDGASRGNPGEAGAGVVIFDRNDQEIATRAQYLGQCTNNTAEYKALLLGLETARELHCRQLSVYMDSQLIVRQITGQYKVKNAGLKPLFIQAQKMLHHFDSWTIDHVPRAENKRADELANQGADNKSNK